MNRYVVTAYDEITGEAKVNINIPDLQTAMDYYKAHKELGRINLSISKHIKVQEVTYYEVVDE